MFTVLLLNRSMLNYASVVFESEIISFKDNAGKKGNVTEFFVYILALLQ